MRWIGEGIIKKDHTVFYSCQRRPHILKRLYYKPEDKTPYRLKQNHPECVDYKSEERFFNHSIICVHAPTEERMRKKKITFLMTQVRPMRSALGGMSK
jgi:hypothetical protein